MSRPGERDSGRVRTKIPRRPYEESVPSRGAARGDAAAREIDFARTSYHSRRKVAGEHAASFSRPSPSSRPRVFPFRAGELLLSGRRPLSATSICRVGRIRGTEFEHGGQSLKENQPLLPVIAFRSCPCSLAGFFAARPRRSPLYSTTFRRRRRRRASGKKNRRWMWRCPLITRCSGSRGNLSWNRCGDQWGMILNTLPLVIARRFFGVD